MNNSALTADTYHNNFTGSTLWDIFWERVNSDTWEPVTLRVFQAVLKGHPEDSVIDFGAWIGPTSLFAAKLCKYVYSIEPDPIAFSALVANVNLNLEAKNKIHLYFGAISSEQGQIKMSGNGDSKSHFSTETFSADDVISQKAVWYVEGRTLPQFVQDEKVEKNRLIKIDVEGAEFLLLPTMKTWLMTFSFKPVIWLSLHGTGDDLFIGRRAPIFLGCSISI